MNATIHCLVVSSRLAMSPRAVALLADAHALGLTNVSAFECADLYFIEGALSERELHRLAVELLTDAVAQKFEWRNGAPVSAPAAKERVIEIALRPGVTDAVAAQILHYAHALGMKGVARAATGQRFIVRGNEPLSDQELDTLARKLLANAVIQRYALGEIEPVFPHEPDASGTVEIIPLTELVADGLLALSVERRAALDLNEMLAIQRYFRAAGREPTDVEFEMIAQTWSEHCVHKTFKGKIQVNGQQSKANGQIDGLLRTYLRAATELINASWVRSAFVDNAGIIDFDDAYEISFKVETHNHPSAIEPFGGANTGVGGVLRDILGVSAQPIAATDVLCFGPQDLDLQRLPEGVLHPRRIRSGVVAGVQDYGNKIGVPTVNGAILYDPGYTANPLVFCGCVGIAPKNKHPREPQAGDRVIVLGGRTGRDGLRGATFSSMTMDVQTGEVAGASVQIGDPITEKGLIEVIVRARDACLYHAITDCGAGGLSSAVGEMASPCGAEIDLGRVRLKYAGLAPWEIWLSEAQERMVLAVPTSSVDSLQSLCDTFDVELTDIGVFTNSGHLCVRHGEPVVLDLENSFLRDGIPQRHLTAILPEPKFAFAAKSEDERDPSETLLKLLAHPNIASKADVIRLYDHEVQGGTSVKPLTGVMNDAPSDACVIKPLGTSGARGIVVSCGINAEFGKRDPYRMAASVIDEAIRNAVAVGADPDRIALLDNFCWGDPSNPETLGTLVEAARGCHDAALHYRTPFISGKDSLNNEYLGADGLRHAIPPTLLISAIGICEDVRQAVTMDLKQAGDVIYLVGETKDELGGSHYSVISNQYSVISRTPGMPAYAPENYRALHRAMRAGLVRACHDLSEGGLAIAAAEMCIGGRLGLILTLATADPLIALFSESNGRLLVEVRENNCAKFEALFSSPIQKIGVVTAQARLVIRDDVKEIISLTVADLVSAWSGEVR